MPWNERLALAHRDHVGEGRERLRVQEHRGAAQDDDRIARSAVPRAQRNAGQAQHLQDVEVVVLERDRERDHVELAQRRAGLEAREVLSAALEVGRVLVVRQERALADDVRRVVEQPVDAPGSRGSTSRRSRGSDSTARRGRRRARHVLEEHLGLA